MIYKNPIHKIQDPHKRKWAEIVQCMDTHLNGVCPLHIYQSRRPLESEEDFALKQRAEAFEPITMQDFELALNKIIDFCKKTKIIIEGTEAIYEDKYIIDGKDIYDYAFTDLVKKRENDPNAIIIPFPIFEKLDGNLARLKMLKPYSIASKDIEAIEDNYLKFFYKYENKINYYIVIENGIYYLEYKVKNETITEKIYASTLANPIIYISNNVYNGQVIINTSLGTNSELKTIDVSYRLPYLYGAAAHGNKFYGQETDFEIQAKRYSFIREFRAKQVCTNAGYMIVNGKHVDAEGGLCGVCNGSGIIKDDSPFGTTFIDYSQISDSEKIPPIVQWSEPPQGVLRYSGEIVDKHYNNMLNALGIVRQNMTNQSGVSKSFDLEQGKKIVIKVVEDNIRVLKEWYRLVEHFYSIEPTIDIYISGEITDYTLNDLLLMLDNARKNSSPPSVLTNIIDTIYDRTINKNFSERIIRIAKKYDILYIYGKDDLMTAKAQLGSLIGIKEVIIHNTIIDVLSSYFTQNKEVEDKDVLAYLDEYYSIYTADTFSL
jgi:hypothetical protein